MQKKLLAVAVTGALVAPAAAIAQSSVTIYGTISTSIEVRSATGGDSSTLSSVPAGTTFSSVRTSSLTGTNAATTPGITGIAATAGVLAAPFLGTTATAPGVADLSSRTTTQGAGSNFGIRVREDLGGGMYAWFQAELSVAGLGMTPISSSSGGTSPSYRNTGLALGSKAWGDIVLGVWDTPYNVNMNPAPQHAAYGNASTSFSAQLFGGLPLGPATNSGQTLAAMCNSTGTFASTAGTCFAHATAFHRRQSNSMQYWSPNFSGFRVRLLYSAEDQKQASNLINSSKSVSPRSMGGSLTYSAGPLYAGLGYERHNDFVAYAAKTFTGQLAGAQSGGFFMGGTLASLAHIPGAGAPAIAGSVGSAGISGSRDDAWNVNVRYTFGAFTVGGYFERLKYTMTYEGTLLGGEINELRKRAYGLEGAYVSGPHTFGIRYAKANEMEGNTSSSTSYGGSFKGEGTAATGMIFGYGYSLSKRTSAYLYHTRITNETNARYAGIVFNGLSPAAGGDPRYTGVGIRHTF
jgi:predicted porin